MRNDAPSRRGQSRQNGTLSKMQHDQRNPYCTGLGSARRANQIFGAARNDLLFRGQRAVVDARNRRHGLRASSLRRASAVVRRRPDQSTLLGPTSWRCSMAIRLRRVSSQSLDRPRTGVRPHCRNTSLSFGSVCTPQRQPDYRDGLHRNILFSMCLDRGDHGAQRIKKDQARSRRSVRGVFGAGWIRHRTHLFDSRHFSLDLLLYLPCIHRAGIQVVTIDDNRWPIVNAFDPPMGCCRER